MLQTLANHSLPKAMSFHWVARYKRSNMSVEDEEREKNQNVLLNILMNNGRLKYTKEETIFTDSDMAKNEV